MFSKFVENLANQMLSLRLAGPSCTQRTHQRQHQLPQVLE